MEGKYQYYFSPSPNIPVLKRPWKKGFFENNVEKGENAGNQHFLLSAQCFF